MLDTKVGLFTSKGKSVGFRPFFLSTGLSHFCRVKQPKAMIQRIQSVYLLLVAFCGLAMYFFTVVSLVPESVSSDSSVYHFNAMQVERISNGTSEVLMRPWPILVLNTLLVAGAVYVLLQFRNRALQIRLTHVLFLGVLAELVLILFDAESLKSSAGMGHMLSFNVWSTLPVLMLFFTRLALAAIKRDEALVRSADRLR